MSIADLPSADTLVPQVEDRDTLQRSLAMKSLNPGTTVSERIGVPAASLLETLLQESAAGHLHLCPRQVLGVRLGLRGLRALELAGNDSLPRFRNRDKSLLTIVETDGCGADGIAVATDCAVGRRTLRVLDYGKVAATLVDTRSARAVRVAPAPESRMLAQRFVPEAFSSWHAYLEAYKIIPDDQLLIARSVKLTRSIAEILSKPNARAICDLCGEEILNDRELYRNNSTLCRSCAGESYYHLT